MFDLLIDPHCSSEASLVHSHHNGGALPGQTVCKCMGSGKYHHIPLRAEYICERFIGVEGTLSRALPYCGLRQSRYWGLAKTHLQHLVTGAALNILLFVDVSFLYENRCSFGEESTPVLPV